jgi:DNA-binding transcriptional LysR family regulator
LSNSGVAAIQAALDGLGVVNVPAYYAHAVVADGRLERIFEDWSSDEESTFYLVYPTGRHRPLRVRRLIEFLQVSAGA